LSQLFLIMNHNIEFNISSWIGDSFALVPALGYIQNKTKVTVKHSFFQNSFFQQVILKQLILYFLLRWQVFPLFIP